MHRTRYNLPRPGKLSGLALALLMAGASLAAAPAQAQNPSQYILTTATTGGTYYPVGVAIATLIKVKLEPKKKIGLSAISSAGSGENVKLLREKEAQFAILQGLFGYWARTGTGKVKGSGPQKNIRSMTMLWQNVEHFIIPKADVKTGTIQDIYALKGSTAGMGKRTSGTFGSNSVILANLGMDVDKDFELVHAGYNATVEAFQNRKARVLGMPGGPPVGAVARLMGVMGDDVRILDFAPADIKKADGGLNLFTPFVIPAGTYPKQTKNINTIAQPNFLAVNADVPAEDVYQILGTIYDNLGFLNGIHKATKVMKLEAALPGLPAPLHPGALRFYKEKGMQVPEDLMAN